jgi:hypothetical protein
VVGPLPGYPFWGPTPWGTCDECEELDNVANEE